MGKNSNEIVLIVGTVAAYLLIISVKYETVTNSV